MRSLYDALRAGNETNVTNRELTAAQGGQDFGPSYRLTVRCPDYYDPSQITAEDIVHDGEIVVVNEARAERFIETKGEANAEEE